MFQKKAEITAEEAAALMDIIFHLYGYDFSQYSTASFHRRLLRFMEDMRMLSAEHLIDSISKNKAVFENFLEKITVNVTEMFRDPEFYQVIKESVFPVISTYPIIKIWHAGCSSGEEAFSLAILLHEAGLLSRTRIYATDINPQNIEKAKKGIVPLNVMKDYTSNYIRAGGSVDFASYYTARYDHALIRSDIRKNIVFSQHNLVTDQVFNEFQLIFCRNVMIYFNRDLQNKVLRLFYESLSNFGFLALGVKETLHFSDLRDKFEDVSSKQKIYRRIK